MPVIVATVKVPTAAVVAVKVALVVPAATTTLAGTVAALLSLESKTVTPPVAAAPFRVTVPAEEFPPIRLAGFRLTLEIAGGFTVRVAFCVPL